MSKNKETSNTKDAETLSGDLLRLAKSSDLDFTCLRKVVAGYTLEVSLERESSKEEEETSADEE